MYFRFSNYTHPFGECLVAFFNRATKYNRRGRPESAVFRMIVRGEIVATGQAAIDARVAEIRNAYGLDGGSAALLRTDLSATSIAMPTGSLRGVQVLDLTFEQEEKKAHFATGLPFSIALEAEYQISDGDPIVEYHEQLTVIGDGGPRYVWQEIDNGPPIRQMVSTNTPVTLLQSGFMVGTSASHAVVNEPLFPDNLDRPDGIQKGNATPKLDGGVLTEWGINWSYRMIFGGPVALPFPTVK